MNTNYIRTFRQTILQIPMMIVRRVIETPAHYNKASDRI
jgi:hypothetical protein